MPLSEPTLRGPIIVTRYLGPTNHRGSRIIATHKRDSETTYRATIPWQHDLSPEDNHLAAAERLLDGWPQYGDGSGPRFRIGGRGHDHDAYYFLATLED